MWFMIINCTRWVARSATPVAGGISRRLEGPALAPDALLGNP